MHEKLLKALDHLYGAPSRASFRESALATAQTLFPTALIAYHDVPVIPATKSSHLCQDSRIKPALMNAWRRFALQSPVVRYYKSGGTDPVIATQDLVTERELRSSALFHECWRPYGVTHQIGLRIWNPTQVSGLSIKRDGKFSDGDKRLMRALYPHFMRALAVHTQTAPMCERSHVLRDLTSAEMTVLKLVACGKRNREIAALLGNSPRTIERHVENILGKLGVETRSAAAGIFLTSRLPALAG